MSKETVNFTDEKSASALPAPETGTREYRHALLKGFYVRVSAPNRQGAVLRQYVARFQERKAGGLVDKKRTLGVVGDYDYDRACGDVGNAMADAKEARKESRAPMPTLREAYLDYMRHRSKESKGGRAPLRQTTVENYQLAFDSYIPADWLNQPIDKLTVRDWEDLRDDCTNAARSFSKRGRKPVGTARFDVFLSGSISGLYRRQSLYHPTLINPVKLLRMHDILGKTPQRTEFIPADKLPAAVAALEHSFESDVQDVIYTALLTGWRRSLILGLRIDRIDAQARTVEFRADDVGGPYPEGDVTSFLFPVPDVLWERVFVRRLTAARASQVYLLENGDTGTRFQQLNKSVHRFGQETIGEDVSLHDLRRTFATHAGELMPSQALSRLMMHRIETGADGEQQSAMTRRYQQRDVNTLRKHINTYGKWFAELVGWSKPEPAQATPDAGLLEMLSKLPQADLMQLLAKAEVSRRGLAGA